MRIETERGALISTCEARRESARRTRQKRTSKLKDYEERCGQLRADAAGVALQLQQVERNYVEVAGANHALRAEIQAFRNAHPSIAARVPRSAVAHSPPPLVPPASAATPAPMPVPAAPHDAVAAVAGDAEATHSADSGPVGHTAALVAAQLSAGSAAAAAAAPVPQASEHTEHVPAVPVPGEGDATGPQELYLPPSLFPGAGPVPHPTLPDLPIGLPTPDSAGPSGASAPRVPEASNAHAFRLHGDVPQMLQHVKSEGGEAANETARNLAGARVLLASRQSRSVSDSDAMLAGGPSGSDACVAVVCIGITVIETSCQLAGILSAPQQSQAASNLLSSVPGAQAALSGLPPVPSLASGPTAAQLRSLQAAQSSGAQVPLGGLPLHMQLKYGQGIPGMSMAPAAVPIPSPSAAATNVAIPLPAASPVAAARDGGANVQVLDSGAHESGAVANGASTPEGKGVPPPPQGDSHSYGVPASIPLPNETTTID
jgi:hypothetical protein